MMIAACSPRTELESSRVIEGSFRPGGRPQSLESRRVLDVSFGCGDRVIAMTTGPAPVLMVINTSGAACTQVLPMRWRTLAFRPSDETVAAVGFDGVVWTCDVDALPAGAQQVGGDGVRTAGSLQAISGVGPAGWVGVTVLDRIVTWGDAEARHFSVVAGVDEPVAVRGDRIEGVAAILDWNGVFHVVRTMGASDPLQRVQVDTTVPDGCAFDVGGGMLFAGVRFPERLACVRISDGTEIGAFPVRGAIRGVRCAADGLRVVIVESDDGVSPTRRDGYRVRTLEIDSGVPRADTEWVVVDPCGPPRAGFVRGGSVVVVVCGDGAWFVLERGVRERGAGGAARAR